MEDHDRQQNVEIKMQNICPALALQDASRSVTDADEEIFLLYTISAPPLDREGLGQINGKHDKLAITINLKDKQSIPHVTSGDDEMNSNATKNNKMPKSRAKKGIVSKNAQPLSNDDLTVIIRQDSTSLRSTNGDTGSVVWRSSVFFAAKVLFDLTAMCLADDFQSEQLDRTDGNDNTLLNDIFRLTYTSITV